MHPITAEFQSEFGPKYGANDHRFAAFTHIVESIANLDRPIKIVETGCARERDNWSGDGQSTLVWDWLVGKTGGSVTSYDASAASVAAARSQVRHATIIQSDSIVALREEGDPPAIDLLYLDSLDWRGGLESPLHHLAELASIYYKLRSGCLIAVDDCLGDGEGKHLLVSRLLKSLGMDPVFKSYVTVWKKS